MTSSGILSIDLTALCANWRKVQSLIGTATAAAVVKTNAYGLGAPPVIRALRDAGCRIFFFATKDEALASGLLGDSTAQLIVLGGARPGDELLFAEQGLLPVLFTLDDAERWAALCLSKKKAFPCVLKVNTGMTRMGVSIAELDALCESRPQWFSPSWLMSHLSCADEPSHPSNRQQLRLFEQALAVARQAFPEIKASLANSAGVLLGAEWHFDLVRPGAALYGINPVPAIAPVFQPVVSLRLPVLQVRDVTAPAYVGYGATRQVQTGDCLAVVAGGYADGVHRALGVSPLALFRGVSLKAIGRISMDTCVFDISTLPVEDRPRPGDYLDVIGGSLDVNFLTQRNASLGYEVLTSLGLRFQRHYCE